MSPGLNSALSGKFTCLFGKVGFMSTIALCLWSVTCHLPSATLDLDLVCSPGPRTPQLICEMGTCHLSIVRTVFADGTKAGFCVFSDMEKGDSLGKALNAFSF